jgi:hypothetical protein
LGFIYRTLACMPMLVGEEGRLAAKMGIADHEYVVPTLINMYIGCGAGCAWFAVWCLI